MRDGDVVQDDVELRGALTGWSERETSAVGPLRHPRPFWLLGQARTCTSIARMLRETVSRIVISCDALYWATTALSTSFTIDGSTRSS